MKGKAIYQPKGKAGEYAEWACNFYVGCSNSCEYCYCKKGILAGVMGQNKPQLKKCFQSENHALNIFQIEMQHNIESLRKHGLFFSFTTDPFLPETEMLTINAAGIAVQNGIPVKILTKCTEWIEGYFECERDFGGIVNKHLYSFGFTLTGHDELEPNASTNTERIRAMRKLHEAGFKTFASIEPIIDLKSSFDMICDTNCICDLYKIGIESGKQYVKSELKEFITGVIEQNYFSEAKIYFKDSLLKQAGVLRSDLPDSCVDRNYQI